MHDDFFVGLWIGIAATVLCIIIIAKAIVPSSTESVFNERIIACVEHTSLELDLCRQIVTANYDESEETSGR